MKRNNNYSVVLVSVLGIFFQFSSLSAQSDLGDLTAFSISASQEPYANNPLSEAFNGVVDDGRDNFRALAIDTTFFSWSVNPFENTQVDTTLFDTVRYTINIYTGLVGTQGVSGKDIILFGLKVAEEDENFGDFHTDFDSLSSRVIGTDEQKALTVDLGTGLISTVKSNEQVLHSVTFSVPHTISKFQLFLPSESTGVPDGVFSIEEVASSAVAVPEPASLGLSMGFFVLFLRFFISRRQ